MRKTTDGGTPARLFPQIPDRLTFESVTGKKMPKPDFKLKG